MPHSASRVFVTVDIIGTTDIILEVDHRFRSIKNSTREVGRRSMPVKLKAFCAICIAASCLVLIATAAGSAQERYVPSSPTVSPYLNLFQNNRNGNFNRALPNYYSLVRPQLQQQRINQTQQQLVEEQNSTINQLQENVQVLQQQPSSKVVTGHNSWFLNTSRYFAQVGSGATGQQSSHAQAQTPHFGTTSSARRR
jgi:hypothetical protein